MDDQLLNIDKFVKFLVENQGKSIDLTINQESHCLRWNRVYDLIDLFDFSMVFIRTCNALEHHSRYQIKKSHWPHWFTKITNFDQNFDYSWNKSKIFGCFYGRPSASRLGLAGHLHCKYPKQSLIKVRFNQTDQDARKMFELQKLYEWSPIAFNRVVDFLANVDQYTSEYHAYDYLTGKYDYANNLNYLYKHIFVDLVVEAHLQGQSFYPTEKIVRSILCRKPFIVMATADYLTYLRQMGFKTFDHMWDERYDSQTGKDRYAEVIKLIDYLANLAPKELEDLNIQAEEIVNHNYQLLISGKFNKIITRIQ